MSAYERFGMLQNEEGEAPVDAVTCRVEEFWPSFILHRRIQAEKVAWDISLRAPAGILIAKKI